MIFRTGSILIVGRCEEEMIFKVYTFLKELLCKEYIDISEQYVIDIKSKEKKNIVKTKIIYV